MTGSPGVGAGTRGQLLARPLPGSGRFLGSGALPAAPGVRTRRGACWVPIPLFIPAHGLDPSAERRVRVRGPECGTLFADSGTRAQDAACGFGDPSAGRCLRIRGPERRTPRADSGTRVRDAACGFGFGDPSAGRRVRIPGPQCGTLRAAAGTRSPQNLQGAEEGGAGTGPTGAARGFQPGLGFESNGLGRAVEHEVFAAVDYPWGRLAAGGFGFPGCTRGTFLEGKATFQPFEVTLWCPGSEQFLQGILTTL